ncbi:MAG: dihydroorotate dehydrogenase [Candidatus Pacebacteria bacterium]|nr:dihydroorotate dehydrogenase [Candidatus Paceibacterota bacterium]
MRNYSIDSAFPVGNAAGHCKSVSEVQSLARSSASFIVVGSITLEERAGNSGNTFNGDPVFCLNSLGLPNPGIEKLKEIGPAMVMLAHAAGKPIILSVAGLSPIEFGKLADEAYDVGFDGIELNLGCPNVVSVGERKPIISYRRKLVSASLDNVFFGGRLQNAGWFVSVKVSPMDPDRIDEIASVIEQYAVKAVVTMNTVPNCLDYNRDETPVINTPDKTGYAGGSGRQVFQQALGQVKQWRARLPKEIAVWGVGGVQSSEDVQKMLWAGASIVQVGTAYFVGGAKVFGDIASQFINLKGD